MIGKLYGVGIGPGDAELITIKAVRTIQKCSIIAIPKSGNGNCTALNIAEQAVPEIVNKILIELNMPMTRDKRYLNECREKAADEIIEYLNEGIDVAFLTLGDPTIYSTYIYIHKIVKKRGFEPLIISGVTSFCAVAAKLGESLTQASQPLHIIPGSYACMEDNINLEGTKVLMKTGKSFAEVKAILQKKNLLQKTKMIQNCGMPNEKIFLSLENTDNSPGYFSIIIINK